jgi:hypothetical protein
MTTAQMRLPQHTKQLLLGHAAASLARIVN